MLSAPPVGRLGLALGNLALRMPGVGRLATSAAERVVRGGDLPLTDDLTAWRDYELVWRPDGVTFAVDGVTLGQIGAAPAGPLGFVAWMDNQWAALRDDGTMAGGYLAVAAPQWLDIARIEIEFGGASNPRRRPAGCRHAPRRASVTPRGRAPCASASRPPGPDRSG